MAQHHDPRILAGALGQIAGNVLANAAQTFGMAGFGRGQQLAPTIGGLCAFGHQHNRIQPSFGIAVANLLGHLVQTEGNFGHQDGVRIAGNAGMQGNPASVAAHHLNHHHALMTLGRAVQAVQALGGETNCRVKAEGGERFVQVVVNGFGHTHHTQAFLMQGVGNGQRAVAANGHQCVNLVRGKVSQDFVRAVDFAHAAVGHFDREVQRIALVGGAQHGAAQVTDAAHLVARQTQHPAVSIALGKQDAVETVADAIAFPAPVGGRNHHRLDHRVESGCVTPAGIDGNAFNGFGHG
ncbi:hypothetical protein GALL_531000 [mine drainage metagenome]|uniref:Uncharacterized protein n=1 Tax=mine drainage metagenome TaxID=410659 RepID=A0A1J5PC09_9ZZZZ